MATVSHSRSVGPSGAATQQSSSWARRRAATAHSLLREGPSVSSVVSRCASQAASAKARSSERHELHSRLARRKVSRPVETSLAKTSVIATPSAVTPAGSSLAMICRSSSSSTSASVGTRRRRNETWVIRAAQLASTSARWTCCLRALFARVVRTGSAIAPDKSSMSHLSASRLPGRGLKRRVPSPASSTPIDHIRI